MLFYNMYSIIIIIFILLSLSLAVSQTNQTNLSNGNNESATENDSAENLEVGNVEFDAFEDELANLASSLSNLGYDWLINYNINLGGNI